MPQFSVFFQLVGFSCDFKHVFNNEQKSSLGGHPARSSGCSSFEKPVATSLDTSSQRRWLRRHKCICTTYVKIQHTAQVSEGLALELGDVNRNTPNAAPHSADVPQTHWQRADQLWNEPQRSQAFAGAAHSLAENLPPSVSTCSSHRKCRNRRRKASGRAHICRHASVATTPSLAFQPQLTEWRRCSCNVDSRSPKGPHAARSSEEDSRGSRAGGYMFKPLPPITQRTPESPIK